METNRDHERVCRDAVDITEEQSDAVYQIIADMFGRNVAPVEEWPDEDQDLLRDLYGLEEGLNRAVRLLACVQRELRQESYRLQFSASAQPKGGISTGSGLESRG